MDSYLVLVEMDFDDDKYYTLLLVYFKIATDSFDPGFLLTGNRSDS
jgi:hypothetical protein